MRLCVRVYMHACVRACVCVYVRVCAYVRAHIRMCECVCPYVRVCACAHVCVCACAQITTFDTPGLSVTHVMNSLCVRTSVVTSVMSYWYRQTNPGRQFTCGESRDVARRGTSLDRFARADGTWWPYTSPHRGGMRGTKGGGGGGGGVVPLHCAPCIYEASMYFITHHIII